MHAKVLSARQSAHVTGDAMSDLLTRRFRPVTRRSRADPFPIPNVPNGAAFVGLIRAVSSHVGRTTTASTHGSDGPGDSIEVGFSRRESERPTPDEQVSCRY